MATHTLLARAVLAVLLTLVLLRQLLLLREMNQRSSIDIGISDDYSDGMAPSHRHEGNDDARHWNALLASATAVNFTCNGDMRPSSLRATLAANGNHTVHISHSSRHPHYRIEEANEPKFVPIDVTFRACTVDSTPQTSGGDAFIVDAQSHWVDAAVPGMQMHAATKSSAFARDNFDGTYTATLVLPRMPSEGTVEVSLRHYYACHEGMRLPFQFGKDYTAYSTGLQFGPLPWESGSSAVMSFLGGLPVHNDTKNGVGFIPHGSQPPCSETERKEDILHGAWREIGPHPLPGGKLSKQARWTPFHCAMTLPSSSTGTHLRVGDSTMPHRGVTTGMPYQPWNQQKDYEYHQRQFTDFLHAQVFRGNETFGANDTMLFGGGLHHIQNGHFNVRSTIELMLRSLCQLGLAFPGIQLLLRGPNPIQQHMYTLVDQTALVAKRINWELRTRMQSAGSRLADLCDSLPSEYLSSFVALADDKGNVLPEGEAAPILLERYNYSWERDSSAEQRELAKWIEGLSTKERRRKYGDRTVQWVDLEEFLLPRSELFRDKIHDNLKFAHGHHSNLLAQMEGDLERYLTSQMEMQHSDGSRGTSQEFASQMMYLT